MNDFASRIIYWRISHEVTQQELADMCNVSRRAILNWEKGNRLPEFDSIITISSILGVSIDWLVQL